LEDRKLTETELTHEIGSIASNFPEYNHTKIANQIFIKHNVAVSSHKVFNILKDINKHHEQKHDKNPIKQKSNHKLSPQNNPKWHSNEIILALDLYFILKPEQIKATNNQIIQLSQILNLLPIHTSRPNPSKFRNPNGIALKLTNFLALDPEYQGKGMSSYSKLDKSIWDEFNQKRADLHNLAISIISSISKNELKNLNFLIEEYNNYEVELVFVQNNDLISQIFTDNSYQLFVKYCGKHDYKYLTDLQEFDFNELYSIPGLGLKKISSIIAIYEKYKIESKFTSKNMTSVNVVDVVASNPVCEESLNYLPLYSNTNFEANIKVFHPSYKLKDSLNNLNLTPRSKHSLQNMNISTVGELLFFTPDQIKRTKNSWTKTVRDLQEAVRKYLLTKDTDLSSNWLSFDSMIKSIIKISERNLHIFKNRLGINHNAPQTLDDSGSPFGLTRERTRQILSSIEKKLKTNINSNLLEPFWLALDLVLNKYHGFIDSKQLSSEVTDLLFWNFPMEGHAILEFSKLHNKYIILDDPQLIVMKEDVCLECKYRVEFLKEIVKSFDQFTINDIYKKYFKLCKDVCSLYNHRKLLNPGQVTYQISNIDYSGFLKFKDNVYYSFECYEEKKENDRRNQLRQNHSAQIYFEDYLYSLDGFATSDEIHSFMLKNKCKIDYGVAQLMQRCDDIFSWGRGLYIHKSKIKISDDFISELQDYLNQHLNDNNPYIAIHKVFNNNENLCIGENIPNHIALYTVLSISLMHTFQFPGFPLITIQDPSRILTFSDLLEDFVKEQKNGIPYSELKKHFVEIIGLSTRSFRFQVRNNQNILKTNNDLLIHKQYLMSFEDETNILLFIEVLLSTRNLSEFALQNHLESVGIVDSMNIALSSILDTSNNILSENNLYYLNETSVFYHLNNNELDAKISRLNFMGLDSKSIRDYLLKEHDSQQIEVLEDTEYDPLNDILTEFG
jgi:5-methylcytosine-specific restriction enzyme A